MRFLSFQKFLIHRIMNEKETNLEVKLVLQEFDEAMHISKRQLRSEMS